MSYRGLALGAIVGTLAGAGLGRADVGAVFGAQLGLLIGELLEVEPTMSARLFRWLQDRLTYGVMVVGAIVGFLFLVALVVSGRMSADHGSFIGTLLAALFTLIFIAEIREDRMARHRPYVLVEIDEQVERHVGINFDREEILPTEIRLIVRNIGNGAARRIAFSLSEPFEDIGGEPIGANPLLQEGIPFLGPNTTMSLTLSQDLLGGFLKQRAFFLKGGQPLPEKALESDVLISYEDAATGRRFVERYGLGYAYHIHGWTIAKNG